MTKTRTKKGRRIKVWATLNRDSRKRTSLPSTKRLELRHRPKRSLDSLDLVMTRSKKSQNLQHPKPRSVPRLEARLPSQVSQLANRHRLEVPRQNWAKQIVNHLRLERRKQVRARQQTRHRHLEIPRKSRACQPTSNLHLVAHPSRKVKPTANHPRLEVPPRKRMRKCLVKRTAPTSCLPLAVLPKVLGRVLANPRLAVQVKVLGNLPANHRLEVQVQGRIATRSRPLGVPA
mmetsp:Transcript_19807/g.41251  ORF Transcript_19807/g.41251 Transcript_19807/m.41251 type:complete len:232 (-) Transcript_19807:12-707(-)